MEPKINIEIDLSRFVQGQAYVLTRDVENPKIDRRMTRGGGDFGAHAVFPKGLRFVLHIYEDARTSKDGSTVTCRNYEWKADGGHRFRFFRVNANDAVTTESDGTLVGRIVYALPHRSSGASEHHEVARQIINALVPEAVTLESLEARGAEFHIDGWSVLTHLIERGLISMANVHESAEALIQNELNDRAARRAEME